jgi:hypothetical protein
LFLTALLGELFEDFLLLFFGETDLDLLEIGDYELFCDFIT